MLVWQFWNNKNSVTWIFEILQLQTMKKKTSYFCERRELLY